MVGWYRHFKGKYYLVVAEATYELTKEKAVVYYDSKGKLWVRHKVDFNGETMIEAKGPKETKIVYVKRFVKVTQEEALKKISGGKHEKSSDSKSRRKFAARILDFKTGKEKL